ncbi:Uncharacterised protein [Mycobacteroides abscessus]|nr:Uncharacterised protein [Mycobacteroides abscessus]
MQLVDERVRVRPLAALRLDVRLRVRAAPVVEAHDLAVVGRPLVRAHAADLAEAALERHEEAARPAVGRGGDGAARRRAARPAVPALRGLVAALRRQHAGTRERELLDRDGVLLLVARRHVAGLEARVVGAEGQHVARADVARAQALGPREPRRREQRTVTGQELDLAHRGRPAARHARERDRPVPAAVAAHRAREAVGDEPVRLGDRAEVLAHVLRALGHLLRRGARELDRAREHGVPRRACGDSSDALLCGCHGGHRQASISSATARRTAATLVALPFSG